MTARSTSVSGSESRPWRGRRLAAGSSFETTTIERSACVGALTALGAKLGRAPIDQVALAWILCHPTRLVPVLGTGKIERVRSAVKALDLRLSRETGSRFGRHRRAGRLPESRTGWLKSMVSDQKLSE